MANVPAVLYLTNLQGQGPRYRLVKLGYPEQEGNSINDIDVIGYVPGGTINEPPTPAFRPWYDGTASNVHYDVASGGNNTVTVSPDPGWSPDEHAGKIVTSLRYFLGNPAFPHVTLDVRRIQGNTSNELTIFQNWIDNPAANDKIRIGTGLFTLYNAQPDAVGTLSSFPPIAQSLGSPWNTLARLGVGMDATAMRNLWERVWPDAPGFRFVKFAQGDHGLYSGWRPGGDARNDFENTELPKIQAAITLEGHTLDWKLVVLDLSQEDIRDWGNAIGTYNADMLELMSWLKTTLGNPSLYFQIVNHHPLFLGGTQAGGASAIRGEHDIIARSEPRVALVDMRNAEFGLQVQETGDPALDDQYYRLQDYFDQGKRVVDTYVQQSAGFNISGKPRRGMPVYGGIGDSIMAGQIQKVFFDALISERLLGEHPNTVRPDGQWVYNGQANGQTGAIELYDPNVNANVNGSYMPTFAGPELTITAKLADLHPERFLFIKRGSNTSGLANQLGAYSFGNAGRWEEAANEHWQDWQADVASMERLLFDMGYVADWRGLFVFLGTNDAFALDGHLRFIERLSPFVQSMRDVLTTRTSGQELPICWRLPNSANGRPTEMANIRQALISHASSDNRFVTFDTDDLEISRFDDLHDTPEAAMIAGRRAVDTIAPLVAVC